MDKKVYIIDGTRFSNLEEFFDEIGSVLIPDAKWGRNWEAFNDILRGGFGTPDEGFILVWQNSQRSREVFGREATLRYSANGRQIPSDGISYEERAKTLCAELERLGREISRKTNDRSLRRLADRIQQDYRYQAYLLAQVKDPQEETLFDWLVRTILRHSKVELRFE